MLLISISTTKKTLRVLKVVKIENSKESGPSVKVKFIFSDNPLRNILRPVCKIELRRIFMERLIVNFTQFCSAFAKFLVLVGRLGARLYPHAIFRLKIFWFPRILSLFFSCVGTKPPPSAKMPWGYLSVKVLYKVKRIIYNIYRSMIVYVLSINLLNGLSMF